SLILSTIFLLIAALETNDFFAKVYKAPVNAESAIITALILALIVPPINGFHDLIFLGWAAVLAMSSKYIIAIGRKHIFNPAAIAVALTAWGIGKSANWWSGNAWMAPSLIIVCYLIARKIRRGEMLLWFLGTVGGLSLVFGVINGTNLVRLFSEIILHSSLWFFAGVMLTEPLTSPTTKGWQKIFAIVTGIIYTPQVHLGGLFFTPETALMAGNVFAYIVSPKNKLILNLGQKIQTAPDTFDFIFPLSKRIRYQPGQYMEWTLQAEHNDNRGNRRYFTLASSPTEDNLRIGVKFYEPSSNFKKTMLLVENQPIVVSQLAGDFILPKNKNEKLVLIAGGIGVTPFRSMIKYLSDKQEKRDIVLLFSNKEKEEIVYKDVFDEAEKTTGLKTIYTLTDEEKISADWKGERGRINEKMIEKAIPDYRERTFYISGPQTMVKATKDLLRSMEIGEEKIRTDYFPGF
ncbi:MAG TPA: oxidoreductase, partial [Patescibacteria group bacterium]